ncbi:MAG: hypothetical protein WAT77_10370 [Paracoccaceae bacterium]
MFNAFFVKSNMELTRRMFATRSALLRVLAAIPKLATVHEFLAYPLFDASSHLIAANWGIIRAHVAAGRLSRMEPSKKTPIAADRVRMGVVMLQEEAWYDSGKLGEVDDTCKHRNINLVTLNIGVSKLAQGNFANTALVEIEKCVGTPPEVAALAIPIGA